jgi:hypothetical protein
MSYVYKALSSFVSNGKSKVGCVELVLDEDSCLDKLLAQMNK